LLPQFFIPSKQQRGIGIAREYRVNQRIRAVNVRVIGEDGAQLGVMTVHDALQLAQEKGLDLVEVAPTTDPPVCRLLDYGRFKYVQTKKEREARKTQKSTGLREMRMRPGIGQHDLDAKFRTVQKLLATGAKVKLSVVFRGRSIAHPELGIELLKKVAEDLEQEAKLERAPAMEGRTLSIILTPITRRDGHARTGDSDLKANGETGQLPEELPTQDGALVAQEAEHAQAQNP
jgi:translation initiation factor IF-3